MFASEIRYKVVAEIAEKIPSGRYANTFVAFPYGVDMAM